MKVLILEDNHIHRADIIRMIGEEHDFIELEVEKSFVDWLTSASLDDVPDRIIIDLMLPWTIPGPNMVAPDDFTVDQVSNLNAGYRCINRLLEKFPECANRIICFTALSNDEIDLDQITQDLEGKISFFQKGVSDDKLRSWMNSNI